MAIISLVVAIDEENGIGKDNKLLCHLPMDLKHFRKVTLHHPIIMGRKTFESIGRPLPHRQNIVITKQESLLLNPIETLEANLIWVSSLTEALEKAKHSPEIMIVGGAQVFKAALSLAHQIYLTQIHHRFNADTFFPSLDLREWEVHELKKHQKDTTNAYSMTFYLLKKRSYSHSKGSPDPIRT